MLSSTKAIGENPSIVFQKSPVFELLATQKDFEEFDDLTMYGIKSYWEESPCHFCQVLDISSKKDFVTQLIQYLMTHQVSPLHLRDIVEDYITV